MYLHLYLPLSWGCFPLLGTPLPFCADTAAGVRLSQLSAHFPSWFRSLGLRKLMTCKLPSRVQLDIEYEVIPEPLHDAAMAMSAPKWAADMVASRLCPSTCLDSHPVLEEHS